MVLPRDRGTWLRVAGSGFRRRTEPYAEPPRTDGRSLAAPLHDPDELETGFVSSDHLHELLIGELQSRRGTNVVEAVGLLLETGSDHLDWVLHRRPQSGRSAE